jgi:hypothetical protein
VKMEKKGHPLLGTYYNMINRCENKETKGYSDYGGRGIKVCKRWREDFWAFVEDMGDRPEGTSLDRIDNEGDYEPENCRWADSGTQRRNRSKDTTVLEFMGKRMCLTDWAKELGISRSLLSGRINKLGWSVERALTTPVDERYSFGTNGKKISYHGEEMTIAELVRRSGKNPAIVYQRLHAGWSPEQAADVPLNERGEWSRGKEVEYNGKKFTIRELAEETGLSYDMLRYRIHQAGWTVEEALRKPKTGRTKP